MSPAQLPFWVQHRHPGLQPDNHFVTSARTGDYNCVAWALQNDDDWLEPDAKTWPPAAGYGDDIGPYIALFRLHGYVVCESPEHEVGFTKVALYGDDHGFAHVARELENGWWTSKLGIFHDIAHASLAALEGERYGKVQAVLRRADGGGQVI